MKKIASLLTLSIALTGVLPAFAAPGDDHGPGHHPARRQQQHAPHHQDNRRDMAHRHQSRDHFAWQGHHFRQGKPVPRGFHADRYRVKDWRARGLYQPPRGQNWAYINGNYVLIAAATGIITTILLAGVSGY